MSFKLHIANNQRYLAFVDQSLRNICVFIDHVEFLRVDAAHKFWQIEVTCIETRLRPQRRCRDLGSAASMVSHGVMVRHGVMRGVMLSWEPVLLPCVRVSARAVKILHISSTDRFGSLVVSMWFFIVSLRTNQGAQQHHQAVQQHHQHTRQPNHSINTLQRKHSHMPQQPNQPTGPVRRCQIQLSASTLSARRLLRRKLQESLHPPVHHNAA